jgi:hypothetical protein
VLVVRDRLAGNQLVSARIVAQVRDVQQTISA